MVDVNTTRATSKKMKDSSAAKARIEDSAIADSLVPGTGPGATILVSDMYTGAISKASDGNLANPTGTTQVDAAERRVGGEADEVIYSLLVDTSVSRKDRAPVAFLHPNPKGKPGVSIESNMEEEEEEDRSPGRAQLTIY
ncbi:hypothetical protein PGTUg99_027585 [Puccinia graminis f. sp. tritici]|uniref:Uncharacterized protein n=1 Tax=Puccinia graminis f. sp. tritici TaxID=56615 RepID=A0A5B0RFX9_PUCGR|nr:hypothetical protein PGTUg99_027585 [Puccinia graminis f. sp. tritici]